MIPLLQSTNLPVADYNFLLGNIPGAMTFTRGSSGSFYNSAGTVQLAATNVARFDTIPSTLDARGLFLEGSRTNSILQNADFSISPWGAGTSGNSPATAASGTAPDGTNTATSLNDNSAAAALGRLQAVTVTSSSNPYSGSVFLKAGTSGIVSLRASLTGGLTVAGEVVVDLSNGNAQWRSGNTGTSFSVQAINNGWYRVGVVITDNASGNASYRLEIRPAFATSYSATLDAAAQGTCLAWGAQASAGNFGSSAIPTTSSAVARSADILTGASSTFIPASVGAYIIRATIPNLGGTANQAFLHLDDGSNNNRFMIYNPSSSTDLRVYRTTGGAAGESVVGTLTAGSTVNLGLTIDRSGRAAASLNGAAAVAVAGGPTSGITTFRLGSNSAGLENMFGYLRRLRVWARSMTDAELAAATAAVTG